MLRGITLAGPVGRLEALVNEGTQNTRFVALVCHPHPLGGGSMHNKVVYHAMKALNSAEWGLGMPVLRFNFRGTGVSQGTHDGAAEADDVAAAVEWLHHEYKRPVIAVGFSFGAAMTLAACSGQSAASMKVRAIISIGLPLHAEERDYDYSFLSDCEIPKLFVSGDQDQFASPAELEQVVASVNDPKNLVILPGADHFFNGYLSPMQSAISTWLKETLA